MYCVLIKSGSQFGSGHAVLAGIFAAVFLELERSHVLILHEHFSLGLAERIRELVLVALLLVHVGHLRLATGLLKQVHGSHLVAPQPHREVGPHFAERHRVALNQVLTNLLAL